MVEHIDIMRGMTAVELYSSLSSVTMVESLSDADLWSAGKLSSKKFWSLALLP